MTKFCDRLGPAIRGRRSFLLAACAVALALTGGPTLDATPAGATMMRLTKTHDVVTRDGAYRPKSIVLRSGDKIRICNGDPIYYKPFTTKRSVGVVKFGTIAPGQCLTTPPFFLPRGRAKSQFIIGSLIQANVALYVTLLPDVGGQIPFTITSVRHPTNITAPGKGALEVTWQGTPRFPVTMYYVRTGECPRGYTCVNPSKTFASPANPLVFPGAVFCGRASKKGIYWFPYSVYLRDANAVQTRWYGASMTCHSP